jgi:hypothetical protein
MPEYRFVLLNADGSVQRDCIMYADTDGEAREIARGLLPDLSVEVWKDSARIYFASRPTPFQRTRDSDIRGKGCEEQLSLRHRYRAEELRVLAVLANDEKMREALLIVAGHYDNMALRTKT